jgi:5'-3' exonuclease
MREPNSALKDYYPEKFELDLNNKKQEWKSVVLLPHIDPRRLQNTLQPIWDQKQLWSASERARNRPDVARILVCDQSETKALFQKIVGLRDPRRKEQVCGLPLLNADQR